ncbi:EFR1 family ferrodoxin [candidate division WOR-3 bacterium]|nr:EFR1 family ferrodoxin [candidate division WOR-3 bacterium]
MKTTIYYFTGTGNSLWAARRLAEKLPDSELVPIVKVWNEQSIVPQSGTIGLVFPLYFQGTPDIVLRFVEKLSLDNADYIFAICTRGLTGGIVFKQLNRILEGKGKHLGYSTYLTMHDNYIVNFDAPSPDRSHRIGKKALARIAKIAELVKQKVDGNSRDPLIGNIMGSLIHPSWVKDLHKKDRNFWSDDKCNSCGTCVRVCPVDNVELIDGKPSWLHHCQQCYACIHLCPEDSIQIGRKTFKRKRYRHPEIKVKDIIDQKR